jgi:DNA-binding winged helix-turn-helix (wHTH) protein
MARPRSDKEPVVELIDEWLGRSGLRQMTVAQRIGLTPDEFYQGYKNTARPIKTDPELALKIVRVFAEQPTPARATAAEVLRFLIRTHLPLDRFPEVHDLFPSAEWQQAVEDLSPDRQWIRQLARSALEVSSTQLKADNRSAPPDAPYLLISLSTDPDNMWSRIYLTERTTLGRLAAHEQGPGLIHLGQPHVSHEHAQIMREQGLYLLKNWRAKYGIGLYEKNLEQGEMHTLRHGDIFRIPNHEEHYRVMFLLSDKQTLVLPFHIEYGARNVRVFERVLALDTAEYDLIVYLYRHRDRVCSFEELVEYLWPAEVEVAGDRRESLDRLLSNVRQHISEASGGFTFMQTIGKIGVRLVV